MYEYRAKVIRVVDGDTIDVDVDLGMKVHVVERLRIAGIDAPETYGVKRESAEYIAGSAARQFLIDLIEGKDVVIKTMKDATEKYGRYLADVYIHDVDVATLLVEAGHAVRVEYN
jgi:micrococcal nuclease